MTEEKKKRSCFSSCWFIIYILGIIPGFFIFCPNMSEQQQMSYKFGRYKRCYSNIRVLLGAVEMYNMDTKIMVTKMNEEFANSLKAKNYLKEIPKCPETNSFNYYANGDITNNGYIFCKYHGGVDRGEGEFGKIKESFQYKINRFMYHHPGIIALGNALLWPFLLILVILGVIRI